MISADSEVEPFPEWDLQPRKETGSASLVSKNPTYDGRGVIIAIFDSGVDPAAGGMQVTTDGKPKLIDRLDGSGSGDVDTSKVVDSKLAEGNRTITGLSGRTLIIPKDWKNPTDKWHVGVKNAFDLYPRGLKDRIIHERQEKIWDPEHKICQANAVKKQQAKPDGDIDKEENNVSLFEKLIKENNDVEVEMAEALDKKFKDNSVLHWLSDCGPVYDCVVYNTGAGLRACIDTSETGDLSQALNLGIYRETLEWGTLSSGDQVSVSVNIWDNGNLLEIVRYPSEVNSQLLIIILSACPAVMALTSPVLRPQISRKILTGTEWRPGRKLFPSPLVTGDWAAWRLGRLSAEQ